MQEKSPDFFDNINKRLVDDVRVTIRKGSKLDRQSLQNHCDTLARAISDISK